MDQGKRVKPMLSGIKMEELTEYNGIEDKENGGGTSGGTSGDTSGGTDKDNPSGGNPPSGDTGKDNTGGGESGGDDNVNL